MAAPSAPPMDTPPQADHEVEISKLFASSDTAGWRVPIALTAAMPFAAFAASVQQPKHGTPTLMIEVVLPCPPATMAEQARFRCPATPPRYAVHVTEAQWCSAVATARLFKVAITAEQALALLIAEHLQLAQAPNQARPFLANWMTALHSLVEVTRNMLWQSLCLPFDRLDVHKARRAIADEARQLPSGWGNGGRTGVTP